MGWMDVLIRHCKICFLKFVWSKKEDWDLFLVAYNMLTMIRPSTSHLYLDANVTYL